MLLAAGDVHGGAWRRGLVHQGRQEGHQAAVDIRGAAGTALGRGGPGAGLHLVHERVRLHYPRGILDQ